MQNFDKLLSKWSYEYLNWLDEHIPDRLAELGKGTSEMFRELMFPDSSTMTILYVDYNG